jgi:hypothetical protein
MDFIRTASTVGTDATLHDGTPVYVRGTCEREWCAGGMFVDNVEILSVSDGEDGFIDYDDEDEPFLIDALETAARELP